MPPDAVEEGALGARHVEADSSGFWVIVIAVPAMPTLTLVFSGRGRMILSFPGSSATMVRPAAAAAMVASSDAPASGTSIRIRGGADDTVCE